MRKLRAALLCGLAVLLHSVSAKDQPCIDAPDFAPTLSQPSGAEVGWVAALSNGFVCLVLGPGMIHGIHADFEGRGHYGTNVLLSAAPARQPDTPLGVTLQVEYEDGRVHSSGGRLAGVRRPEPEVVERSSNKLVLRMRGIVPNPSNMASNTFSAGVVSEDWTITLRRNRRHFGFQTSGRVIGSLRGVRCIRRRWMLSPSSVYGLFEGGVVQVRWNVR